MQKWEYRTTLSREFYSTQDLDEQGVEGWELVSVIYTSASDEWFFFYKRPKQEQQPQPQQPPEV